MMKIILFLILTVSSTFAHADTYPAITSTTYQTSNINTGSAAASSSSLSGACTNGSAPPINILTVGSNGRACTFTQYNSPPEYTSKTFGPIDNYQAVTVTTVSNCPGGGVLSGNNCINAPACTAPQVRNATTGVCVDPPFVCPPAGTPADIAVLQGENDSFLNPPESGITISITESSNSKMQAVSSGIGYEYTPEDFIGGCFHGTADAKIYCDYHAKSTGTCQDTANSSANNAKPAVAAASTDVAIKASPSGTGDAGCLTDAKGNTTCTSNPKENRKCGKVNGSEICIDTTPGTGTLNGKPYQTSAKNCGYFNGNPVCVSNDGTSATKAGCVQNGGVRQCVNADLKTVKDSTTVGNPDGTTTTTKTESSNLIGDPGGTSTTTTAPNGDSTTISTGGGADGAGGSGKGKGQGDVNCDRYPDTLGCQSMKIADVFKPDDDLVHSKVNAGFTPVGGFSSNGSCPSPKTFTVFGKPYSFPWDPVCSFASQMRPIMVIVASIVALMIIFSVA